MDKACTIQATCMPTKVHTCIESATHDNDMHVALNLRVTCTVHILGTLVPNSRIDMKKMATEFFALQNTP